jgi:aminoglycoside 2''-phosphotransferase
VTDEPVTAEDRARIAALAPDLDVQIVRRDNGQFNDILIVNDAWVVRFPKSAASVASLAEEAAFLRAVARRLPLATPELRYLVQAGSSPGMGYPLLFGAPLSRDWLAAAPVETQLRIGQRLGEFLRALHALPPDLLIGFPVQDGRAEWMELYGHIRESLFPHMRADAREEVAARFEAFLAADAENWPPVPRHGDFGAGNVLYDFEAGEVTGVVDFGSAGLGDPAVDFAALATMGERVVEGALSAYPDLGAYRERAAFYHSTFALQQAWYGLRDGSVEDFEDGIARYR